MTLAATNAILEEYCKELHLSAVLTEYPALCRQAQDAGWGYESYLQELFEREITKRRNNATHRKLREAHFPDIKTLDQLDWTLLQGVSKPKVQSLSSGQFITEAEDVVIIGPIGTGKTHLAIAIGVEAAKRRTRVLFVRAAEMVRQLVEAKNERQLTKLHRTIQTIPLLIIDELGFIPFDKMESELLFNLLADRYEKHSTMVTSNLAFSEWVQIFGSEKLATALLDRLAHHAHVITTKGKSYRTRRKGEQEA